MKNNMKFVLIGLIIGIIVSSFSTLALTGNIQKELYYNDIKITLNGEEMMPTDANGTYVEPFIIDGTTYLPVRAIASALGLDVNWDDETSTVILNNETPDTPEAPEETVGNQLLAAFEATAANGNALAVAEALVASPAVEALSGLGAMEVEEGYLTGFDDTEIRGFKECAMFAPMIGTIPFVGYVFTIEDEANAPAFIETLESAANLRWNICTAADEMVSGSVGNKVFFVMCPTSFAE